jgi:predicted Zn-dependent peptidase
LQSWLVFGHALPQVPLEDQAALEVMNYILAGGHLWTRMTIETRYKYGFTNDASGFLEDQWFGPGGYNFRSYSRPEVISNIHENMMDEVFRIRSEEVSEEEMFVAFGALAEGYFQVAYLDGYATTRSFALERLRYGNHDRSASYVQRIRKVSKDDVLNSAREYLRPDEMQVILVGEDAFQLE